jgi:probable HAF family extracellular repeat protein
MRRYSRGAAWRALVPKRAFIVLASVLSLAVADKARATPMFSGLGDLEGGTFHSIAYAISADGSVVVGSSGSGQAFRWTASSGMVGLGGNEAFGVSANGSVIVGRSGSDGIIWTEGGSSFTVGSLPHGQTNGNWTAAFGVSGDGMVVVGHSPSTDTGVEAFRWTADGIMGLGATNSMSTAFDASADGSVIVGATGGAGSDQPFRWTLSGGMVGLGHLPGVSTGQGYAVSADGAVVVGLSGVEAFRWTSGSGMQGLGFLPGLCCFTFAYDVSADGSVVVGVAQAGSGVKEAFVWDASNGMRPLVDVLSDAGLDLAGWHLDEARAISDDGLTIAGSGRNPNGFTEAWVAVIPEPDTALLLAYGLVAISVSRRRTQ